MTKKLGFIWLLVFGAVLGYLALLAGSFPEHLATHFDFTGKPNGFQSKFQFLSTLLFMVFLINGLFLIFFLFINRFPSSLINLPRKDYWFATPERKILAFERLRAVLALLGVFVNTVLLFTVHIIYQGNTQDPIFHIPINGGVIGILVCAVFFICLVFLITRPPSEE
jgi:uncharacterized membrane protein